MGKKEITSTEMWNALDEAVNSNEFAHPVVMMYSLIMCCFATLFEGVIFIFNILFIKYRKIGVGIVVILGLLWVFMGVRKYYIKTDLKERSIEITNILQKAKHKDELMLSLVGKKVEDELWHSDYHKISDESGYISVNIRNGRISRIAFNVNDDIHTFQQQLLKRGFVPAVIKQMDAKVEKYYRERYCGESHVVGNGMLFLNSDTSVIVYPDMYGKTIEKCIVSIEEKISRPHIQKSIELTSEHIIGNEHFKEIGLTDNEELCCIGVTSGVIIPMDYIEDVESIAKEIKIKLDGSLDYETQYLHEYRKYLYYDIIEMLKLC